MSQIRLIRDLPVEAKHGMTAGRVLDVIGEERSPTYDGEPGGGRLEKLWVMGDAGEKVGVLLGEFEYMES